MKSTLNVVTKVLAVADPSTQSNPRLRAIDWTRDISGVEVENAKTIPYELAPGESVTVFDGTRSTLIDGTTAFDVELMTIGGGSRYRIKHSGGTAPGFRTARVVAIAGVSCTLTAQSNGSLRVSAGTNIFGTVQVGDSVFIPHTTTGDVAGVFSVLNAGFWTVLAVTAANDITLVRPDSAAFEGVSQIVSPAANSEFQVFSASGVQVDDEVDITAGFNSGTRKTFSVAAVTPTQIEVVSTAPLAEETGVVPAAAGISFYSSLCRFVYLESSQVVIVRVNGDVSDRSRAEPSDASDANQPGQFMVRGPVWSLVLVNRANVAADVIVLRAE